MGRAEGLELGKGLRNKRELLGLPRFCTSVSVGTGLSWVWEPAIGQENRIPATYWWNNHPKCYMTGRHLQFLGGAWMCIKLFTVKKGNISRCYATTTNGRQERSGKAEENMQRWTGNREWAPKEGSKRKKLKHFLTTILPLFGTFYKK